MEEEGKATGGEKGKLYWADFEIVDTLDAVFGLATAHEVRHYYARRVGYHLCGCERVGEAAYEYVLEREGSD